MRFSRRAIRVAGFPPLNPSSNCWFVVINAFLFTIPVWLVGSDKSRPMEKVLGRIFDRISAGGGTILERSGRRGRSRPAGRWRSKFQGSSKLPPPEGMQARLAASLSAFRNLSRLHAAAAGFNHGWTPMDTDTKAISRREPQLIAMGTLVNRAKRPLRAAPSVFIGVHPWFQLNRSAD